MIKCEMQSTDSAQPTIIPLPAGITELESACFWLGAKLEREHGAHFHSVEIFRKSGKLHFLISKISVLYTLEKSHG